MNQQWGFNKLLSYRCVRHVIQSRMKYQTLPNKPHKQTHAHTHAHYYTNTHTHTPTDTHTHAHTNTHTHTHTHTHSSLSPDCHPVPCWITVVSFSLRGAGLKALL